MRFTFAVVVGFIIGFLPALEVARGGETSADVTVRRWPAAEAPAVRDLPAGAPVVARGHWRGWVSIAGPARGWIPVSSYSSNGDAKPASPGAMPAAQAQPTASKGERSEGDLLFDAMTSGRGDTPHADQIAKVVAEANAEVKRKEETTRKKRVAVMALYWKDPFADDPERPIPVKPRPTGRELVAARRLAARARADTAAAQAEAAAARAEAARAKADAARAEASAARADALAAKHDAALARAGCADPTAARAVTLARGGGTRERTSPPPDRDRPRVIRTPAHHGPVKVAIAHDDAPSPAATRSPAEEPPPPLPSNAHSTDPRGIVIVPINAAPAAPAAH